MDLPRTFVAFSGTDLVARGPLTDVVLAARRRATPEGPRLALYDDETGQPFDVDLSGDDDAVVKRLAQHPVLRAEAPPKREGPGRPKLGVVSREVSLLPRHWDWLSQQRGGASATLRRLVETARKEGGGAERVRQALDGAYRFLHDIDGNLPGFEEASRALFRKDWDRLDSLTSDWPPAIREQLTRFVDRARNTSGSSATSG